MKNDTKAALLSLAGSLVFMLIFSWSTTPLYLSYGGDSPFYELIGLGMTQGKVPYVDLFDHKGPIVFFMNALGFSFGLGRTGLFMLQVLLMSVTFFLFWKIACLFTTRSRSALYAVLLSMIPLVDFITEGNQCEEWMLPMVTASVLIVCRYILSGRDRFQWWGSLFLGVAFGWLFYIRPNDGVMHIGGMYFGLFILWLVRRSYRQIVPNIGLFLAGFLLVSAPIFVYFASHQAVDAFIYGMIIHNLRYAGDALFTWGGIGMILIPGIIIGVILYLSKKDGRKDLWYVFIPMLVFILILIGKRDYYHYLIPLLPTIVVCFSMCLEHRWKTFLWVVCVLFGLFSYRECVSVVKSIASQERFKVLYSQTDALFDLVPEAERNSIWNYNLTTYMEGHSPHLTSLLGSFLHKGVTPGNPVFVYFQLDYMDPGHSIVDAAPKWVLMQPDDYFKKDFDYIYENYELVGATPSEPVCEVRLYRRRQDNPAE